MQKLTSLDEPQVAAPPPSGETRPEQAKRLLLEFASLAQEEDAKEMRECAENLLAEDQYEAVVIVLTRMSGKPARQVRRVLKTKLGITS
jgi:hypothetical protein